MKPRANILHKREARNPRSIGTRARKPLTLEQRGRFWQSVVEVMRFHSRATKGGKE